MLIAIQVPGACCQETEVSHWPLSHHVTLSLDVTTRGCGAKLSVQSDSGKYPGGVWTESSWESPPTFRLSLLPLKLRRPPLLT